MIKCYGTLNSLSTSFNPSVYPLTTTWLKLFLLLTKIFLSKLTQSPQSCSLRCAGCGCGLQCCMLLLHPPCTAVCTAAPVLPAPGTNNFRPQPELDSRTIAALFYSFGSDKSSLLLRNTLAWFCFS